MFARDVPHVSDVHDATLMPHDAHGDGVLAHLGGHVAIHLDAQLLQHQQAYAGGMSEVRGQRSETTQHGDVLLTVRLALELLQVVCLFVCVGFILNDLKKGE